MNEIAAALGPVFMLILFGALLRKLDFPGEHFWPQAERFTYFVLFPAMLIAKLATAEVGETPLLPTFGNIAWLLLGGSLIIWLLRKQLAGNGPAFTSVYQGGVRFNTYIGLACADALYGDAGLIVAAVTVAIMIPLVNVLCVASFHLTLHRANSGLSTLLRSLAGNPLILGCLIGIGLNRSGIGLPGWSGELFGLLGSAALPLGLLAVGVALDLRVLHGSVRELAGATLLRFLIMPLLVLLGLMLMPLPALNAQVLLLFGALPTATSAYILARQLGGDTVLMANIVTLQTLVGFVTLPLWLLLAAVLWPLPG